MKQTSNAERTVPTRRMHFEPGLHDVPRHFAADGDLLNSHLCVALSSVFPDGEDFFVRSVRHYRDQIVDPDLKRQVAGFIGQEAIHGREHRVLNQCFDDLGYPSKFVERLTKKGLALRTRVASPMLNLATTAALEHFTATLAELLLTDEYMREQFGHDEVRNIFVWHALEESEHKAVAFDVYKAVGGGERMRVITMKVMMYGFVLGMAVQMLFSLAQDKAAYSPRRLRRSWKTFRKNPMISKKVWDQLADYNRPDFHPDDQDTDALVTEWRARLFGDEGSLNDRIGKATVAA